jgi:hypothetical protein
MKHVYNPDAYDEGWAVGNDGGSEDENPYNFYSDEYNLWLEGFDAGYDSYLEEFEFFQEEFEPYEDDNFNDDEGNYET